MANTNGFRFIRGKSQDNTARTITQDMFNLAYAATLKVITTAQQTTVTIGQLTGALTLTFDTTQPYIGDILQVLFAADGTNRTVTFGTNIKSSGTLTITASKFGAAEFIFDGTNWIQLTATATA